MWWRPSLYLFALMMPLLALQGCGFEPVYAKRNPQSYETSTLLSTIEVRVPHGKLAELFKARLEDNLSPKGAPSRPFYILKVDLKSASDEDIIEQDGTASRYTIKYTAPFQLVTAAGNQEIEKGTIRRLVSYNVSQQDDYSTFIAREDAQKRGMVELAEDFKMRIGAIMNTMITTPGQ